MGKLKQSIVLSRRGLLKSAGAAAAAVSLAGCSKDDGEVLYLENSGGGNLDITIPADEKIVSGTMGNNCGGKCIIRAHISGGVIKRFTSDETPEGTGDEIIKPQKRACLKCRGKRSEIYKSDRLLYPLRQDGERGDVNGFVRISWETAFKEIAEKLQASLNREYQGTDPYFNEPDKKSIYGKGTMFAPFGGGPTHALASYNFSSRLNKCVGGTIPTNMTAMSYPATNFVDKYTNNSTSMLIPGMYAIHNMLITEPNDRRDMFNCKHIVLWGFNPADSIMDTNTMYLLIQAKEKGIPITVIDPHVTRTSLTLGAKHLAPIGGTDSALVFAILYHLIKLQLKETNITNGRYLDFEFIKKSCHGFFDMPNPTTADFYIYKNFSENTGPGATNPEKYRVPAGASLSAYILGNEEDLITAGYNYAPSIYPETIGYNVNSAEESPDGEEDELYRKRVPVYGQAPKTPEWAEMITGVPAQDIKELAETLGTLKNVGIFTGWGSNRTVEGEQAPFAINSLAAVLGCWGDYGKFWGSTHMTMNNNAYFSKLPAFNTSTMSSSVTAQATAIENDIINYRRYNAKMSFPYVTPQNKSSQIAEWADMAANGGTGKSWWNDPQIKFCPPVRSFFIAGGDPVNQSGDNKRSMETMKDRSKIDLVVSMDIFMSPTAQYSDYVLPAAMPFEMESFTNGKSAFICVPKAVDAPGECMPDMHIIEGIAKNINPAYEKEICGLKTCGEIQKEAFETIKAESGTDMTFEEFKEKGYIDFARRNDETLNAVFKNFRTYLTSGGTDGTPLMTTSGKFEIYSQGMVEDYESRRWYNFDDDAARYGVPEADLELKHIGKTFRDGVQVEGIYTAACEYTNNKEDIPTNPGYDTFSLKQGTESEVKANMKKARFVYPIPMYIPLIEGCHACDGKTQGDYGSDYPSIENMRHPDPAGLKTEYPYLCGNHHSIHRAHTCGDNNSYATETYKLNGKGGQAFRSMNRGRNTITAGKGLMPAGELGVYEPLYISPEDADALSLKTGDTILVTSPRAAVLMCANVTNSTRKEITYMGEGAWSSFMDCAVTFPDGTRQVINADVAGSANSLATQRPSRICQASGYGSYQRIRIQKIASVELA